MTEPELIDPEITMPTSTISPIKLSPEAEVELPNETANANVVKVDPEIKIKIENNKDNNNCTTKSGHKRVFLRRQYIRQGQTQKSKSGILSRALGGGGVMDLEACPKDMSFQDRLVADGILNTTHPTNFCFNAKYHPNAPNCSSLGVTRQKTGFAFGNFRPQGNFNFFSGINAQWSYCGIYTVDLEFAKDSAKNKPINITIKTEEDDDVQILETEAEIISHAAAGRAFRYWNLDEEHKTTWINKISRIKNPWQNNLDDIQTGATSWLAQEPTIAKNINETPENYEIRMQNVYEGTELPFDDKACLCLIGRGLDKHQSGSEQARQDVMRHMLATGILKMSVTKFNYVGFDENFDEYLQKHRRESLEPGPHTIPIYDPKYGIIEPGSLLTPDKNMKRKLRSTGSSSSSSSSAVNDSSTGRKRPKTEKKGTINYLKVSWPVIDKKGIKKSVWYKGITQSSLAATILKVTFPEENPEKVFNIYQDSTWESMTESNWNKLTDGEDVV